MLAAKIFINHFFSSLALIVLKDKVAKKKKNKANRNGFDASDKFVLSEHEVEVELSSGSGSSVPPVDVEVKLPRAMVAPATH